jgi:DNA modification methylase
MTTITTFNRIIQGDCLNILPQLAAGSVNFALTDPPYLARYQSRDGVASRTTTTTHG